VIILSRIGSLFFSLKHEYACMHSFNEQKKGPNLLSVGTWSVLGGRDVRAKGVYYLRNPNAEANN